MPPLQLADTTQVSADPAEPHDDAVTPIEAKRLRDVTEDAEKHPPVTRQTFVEFLKEEQVRVELCSSLPCTIVIWILFVVVVWLHGNVPSIYRARTAITRAVDEIDVPYQAAGSHAEARLTLEGVKNAEALWTWLATGLVPALDTGDGPGGSPTVRSFNRVVGGISVLRQRRVQPTPCKASSKLIQHFGMACHREEGATSLKTFGIMPMAAQDTAYINGGGLGLVPSSVAGVEPLTPADVSGYFYACLDVAKQGKADSPGSQRVIDLYQAGWIDDATELVEAHAAMFNAEVGMFVHMRVDFRFQRGGLVSVTKKIRPLTAVVFPSTLLIVMDVLWMLLMVFMFLNTIQGWADSKRRGFVNRCCGDPWLALDWVGSITGILVVVFFFLFTSRIGSLSTRLAALPHLAPMDPSALPANATIPERTAVIERLRMHQSDFVAFLLDLEWCLEAKETHRLMMFWYVSGIMLRFFRGFGGQPRIATIGNTLSAAGSDVIHLGLLLLVVFGNFVIGGCVLFGSELDSWASFPKAMRSSLNVVFGSGNFREMYDIHPLSASAWLFCFILSVIFILRNMLFAILYFYHQEVQEESGGEGKGLLAQLLVQASDLWWSVSYVMRITYRFVQRKLPPELKVVFKPIDPETKRVRKVPYDLILANLGAEGYEEVEGRNASLAEKHKWDAVDVPFLMKCGCDAATASRLFAKGRVYSSEHTPDTYPPERLLVEFEGSMERSYGIIDAFSDQVSDWIQEKVVDTKNVEQRQLKLENVSADIRPTEDTPPVSCRALEDASGSNIPALEDGEGESGFAAIEGGDSNYAIRDEHEPLIEEVGAGAADDSQLALVDDGGSSSPAGPKALAPS